MLGVDSVPKLEPDKTLFKPDRKDADQHPTKPSKISIVLLGFPFLLKTVLLIQTPTLNPKFFHTPSPD